MPAESARYAIQRRGRATRRTTPSAIRIPSRSPPRPAGRGAELKPFHEHRGNLLAVRGQSFQNASGQGVGIHLPQVRLVRIAQEELRHVACGGHALLPCPVGPAGHHRDQQSHEDEQGQSLAQEPRRTDHAEGPAQQRSPYQGHDQHQAGRAGQEGQGREQTSQDQRPPHPTVASHVAIPEDQRPEGERQKRQLDRMGSRRRAVTARARRAPRPAVPRPVPGWVGTGSRPRAATPRPRPP